MQISVINRDFLGQFHRGFTLVELLVVLAIASLLIALAPASMGKLLEGSQYRETLRSLVIDLRSARQRAISSRQEVKFQVDFERRLFGIEGGKQSKIPTRLEVRTQFGQLGESQPTDYARLTFLPDGGSTGGSIELLKQSGGGVKISVDWLLGRITQEPRQQ